MDDLILNEAMEFFKASAANDDIGAENRMAFAAAVKPIINEFVAEKSLARRIFFVDTNPGNGTASYSVDSGAREAFYLPRIGAVPTRVAVEGEIFVPGFDIADMAGWHISHAKMGRLGTAKLELTKLKNAFVRKENEAAIALINGAVTPANTVSNTDKSLTKSLLNLAVAELDGREGYNAKVILVNSKRAGDMRLWGANEIDPKTMREGLEKAGGLGSIWGIDIIQHPRIGLNEFFVIDTDRAGIMPIYEDVQIQENPGAIKQLRVEYIGWEIIGMAIADPLAIVKGTIATS